jgi:hypothetical protein
MACPTCTRLSRDEALIESAIAERRETLRAVLGEIEREKIEREASELAALLERIIERRA